MSALTQVTTEDAQAYLENNIDVLLKDILDCQHTYVFKNKKISITVLGYGNIKIDLSEEQVIIIEMANPDFIGNRDLVYRISLNLPYMERGFITPNVYFKQYGFFESLLKTLLINVAHYFKVFIPTKTPLYYNNYD